MDSAQASNAASCSVLRVHASLSTSAVYALVVSLAQGVFDVCMYISSHREMRNNNNAFAMCVIPAGDAAKEDLEGLRVAERGEEAKELTQEPHGLGKVYRLWRLPESRISRKGR